MTEEEQGADTPRTAGEQAEIASPSSAAVPLDHEAEFKITNESLYPRGGVRFKGTDLEQGLARDKTYGTSDEEIALHLEKVQLTERLSSKRLATLQGEFPSQTDKQALQAVADAAEFLDLPESDIPSKPTPGNSEQAGMLTRAKEYVQRTIHGLPALTATRKSTCFADASGGERMSYGPLHKVGDSTVTVLRDADGRESVVEGRRRDKSPCGLTSLS